MCVCVCVCIATIPQSHLVPSKDTVKAQKRRSCCGLLGAGKEYTNGATPLGLEAAEHAQHLIRADEHLNEGTQFLVAVIGTLDRQHDKADPNSQYEDEEEDCQAMGWALLTLRADLHQQRE